MTEQVLPTIAAKPYDRKQLVPAVIITIVVLLISLWLLIQVSPSPLTLSHEIWLKKMDVHLHEYPFSVRPFQTYATLGLHHALKIPIRESFAIIQFALALILGPVFYVFLRYLRFTHGWSLAGVFMFMAAYPMIGAHWAPTHTWDDFWGYLFLLLTFLFMIKHQPLTASIFLTLGIIAREPLIIFVIILALGFWWDRKRHHPFRLLIALALPVIVFVLLRLLFGNPIDTVRWTVLFRENFGTKLKASDAIASTIISFGYLWVLSVAGLKYAWRNRALPYRHLLIWGYVITVPLTVAMTYTGALARETRLLFPPFLFVIPLSLIGLERLIGYARLHWRTWKVIGAVFLIIALSVVGILLSKQVLFPEFDYKVNQNVRQPLAGVYLGMMLGLVILYALKGINAERNISLPSGDQPTA